MTRYLVRRALSSLTVLFGISVVTFAMIYFLPVDPARMYAGPHASVETVARIRHQMGLDLPLWDQYGRYVARALQGDFGYSYDLQMPVTEAVLSRFPYTLELIFAAIFVELVLGLPLGVAAAVWKNSWIDGLATVLALLGVSSPPFWLGLLFLYFFAFQLGLFPLGGVGGLSHLVLPALTAGLGGVGWYARMTRSSLVEALGADFVRTARAKGLSEWTVVLKHAVKNALNPIVTMAGQDIPWFVGGVVVVEMVYAWPGVGRLAVEAILADDVPLIMGTVTLTALLVVASSIVIDIAQAWIDPRIRLEA
ncbi:MAG: ABC transporter permease [Clostridia bacterium]|nr:ABC transporter permease [Clostridia bacterium]